MHMHHTRAHARPHTRVREYLSQEDTAIKYIVKNQCVYRPVFLSYGGQLRDQTFGHSMGGRTFPGM